MAGQGITNLRISFDESLNANAVSFSLDGVLESYDADDVSGKATVDGENVVFDVGYLAAGGEFGFDGTLDEGRTSGSGIVSHRIKQDGASDLIGADPEGTITKQ